MFETSHILVFLLSLSSVHSLNGDFQPENASALHHLLIAVVQTAPVETHLFYIP